MTGKTITAVAGFGRCGSTLMMRMLRAGGMQIFCDAGKTESCETDHIFGLPSNWGWLSECQGKAVKLLDPHKNRPVSSFEFRFIWMNRDPIEQAKSQLKLLNVFGEMNVGSRHEIRAMASLNRRDLKDALGVCKLFGPTMAINFEDVLTHPEPIARSVSLFLDRELDVKAMAAQVVQRSPKCLHYMLEERYLEQGRAP
jgi:hypothetical protein